MVWDRSCHSVPHRGAPGDGPATNGATRRAGRLNGLRVQVRHNNTTVTGGHRLWVARSSKERSYA